MFQTNLFFIVLVVFKGVIAQQLLEISIIILRNSF